MEFTGMTFIGCNFVTEILELIDRNFECKKI